MQIDKPSHSQKHYDMPGGEPAVRRLATRFYDLMDHWSASFGIRQQYPTGLRL